MNQESIQRNIDLLESKETLTNKERRKLDKLKRRVDQPKREFDFNKYKKPFFIIAAIALAIPIIGGFFLYMTSKPVFPPISQQGHIEQSPSSHILTEAIPDAIQRHMLEHADGEGPPGVIIQYNCEDYECEGNLVEKLTKIVEEYPEFVYLAPSKYDGKIILTRDGGREVFEEYDEDGIKRFILN